jgi:hypothetical protein
VNYDGLPYGKGERRADAKRRRGASLERRRRECRVATWQRARARCENPRCRRFCVLPEVASSPAQDNVGHVHEEPFRSRGGDPTDPRRCVLACNVCHDGLHRKRRPWLRVAFEDPEAGSFGGQRWEEVSRGGDQL